MNASVPQPLKEPLILVEKSDVPIACDMTGAPDSPAQRLAEYGRLFDHALVGRTRTADAVEFRFAAKPGVAEWIADLVKREAACCPFFSFEVKSEPDSVVWRTSSQAGPEVQAFLDEFHELPERCAEGFDGLMARLRDRGVVVVARGDTRFELDSKAGERGLLKKLLGGCGC